MRAGVRFKRRDVPFSLSNLGDPHEPAHPAQGMIVMPDAPHGRFNRAVVLADGERLGIEVLPTSAPVSMERDGRLLGHAEAGATLDLVVHPDAARLRARAVISARALILNQAQDRG